MKVMMLGRLPVSLPSIGTSMASPFDPRRLGPGQPMALGALGAGEPSYNVDWLTPSRVTSVFPQNLLRPTNKGAGQTRTFVPGPTSTDLTLAPFGASGLQGLRALGQVMDSSTPAGVKALIIAYNVLGIAGMGLGAYHGYKRNGGSVGWAIGWGLLGGIFPIIVIPVAFAQGIGKRKR